MTTMEYERIDAPSEAFAGEGIQVENLGKSYGKRTVVKNVSLSLKRGEVVGLLGPNGAGKTTCFYMITGLVSADHGRIMLDGEDITGFPMYQRARLGIGYLPQEASIFRGLTVEQNILAVLELIEKDRTRREAALEGLLTGRGSPRDGAVLCGGRPRGRLRSRRWQLWRCHVRLRLRANTLCQARAAIGNRLRCLGECWFLRGRLLLVAALSGRLAGDGGRLGTCGFGSLGRGGC